MPHDECWLIVGGDSTIGAALARQASDKGYRVLCTSRRTSSDNVLSLDLASDPTSWVLPERVDVAFLCAAVTSIEVCRTQPVQTRLLNVARTLALARLLAARGVCVVFLSTNQVFDGSQPHRMASDPTCPLTEYGRQKAEAEREILDMGGAVVRLTKVVGDVPPLLRSWNAALRRGEPIEPFEDMVFSPVPIEVATEALIAVGTRKFAGIVQVSGDRDASYAEVARRLAGKLGVDPGLVRPVGIDSRGLPSEAAPRYTTLDAADLRREFGIAIPRVELTIDDLIAKVAADRTRQAA